MNKENTMSKCRYPVAVICGRADEFEDFIHNVWEDHQDKFVMVIPDDRHRHQGTKFCGHIVMGTADVFKDFEDCVMFVRSRTRWPAHSGGSSNMGPLG